MRRLLATLAVLMSPLLSMACVLPDIFPLTPDELVFFKDKAVERIPHIKESSRIRTSRRLGVGDRSKIELEFEPHRVENGAEFYYTAACDHLDGEWLCGYIQEKRGLSFEDPDDFVEIPGFDGHRARRVLDAVREALVVDSAGRYRFYAVDGVYESETGLDILRLRAGQGGLLVADVASKGCTFHTVEVRESQCEDGGCTYEVVNNEMVLYQ